MKKTWITPELQDLTISATACTDMQGGHGGWNPWDHGNSGKPGKPGWGGPGGGNMSPSEFHPVEQLS